LILVIKHEMIFTWLVKFDIVLICVSLMISQFVVKPV